MVQLYWFSALVALFVHESKTGDDNVKFGSNPLNPLNFKTENDQNQRKGDIVKVQILSTSAAWKHSISMNVRNR